MSVWVFILKELNDYITAVRLKPKIQFSILIFYKFYTSAFVLHVVSCVVTTLQKLIKLLQNLVSKIHEYIVFSDKNKTKQNKICVACWLGAWLALCYSCLYLSICILLIHQSVWYSQGQTAPQSNSLLSIICSQTQCNGTVNISKQCTTVNPNHSGLLSPLCSISLCSRLSEPRHSAFSFHLCVSKARIALFIMKIDLVSMMWAFTQTHTHGQFQNGLQFIFS